MANQRIDQLNAETAPAAADVLPVFSIAGSDTKKITVKNLVQQGVALVDDASIPAAKVNLGALNIVNASIDASAAIAYSKLAALTSGNIVLGNSSNVATSTAITGDVTISNTGVTAIAAGVIVNADINASAAIVDTKLATIATAGKVSNSATTAASANTASAIVARDASGNFTAGTITAALTGTASGNLVSGGALGTPSSGTLTSCTGLPISTGVSGLGTGAATFLTTPSSANLAALLTDETGTGAAVFATSPTFVTPALGTPSSGVLTNCTNLPIATVSVAGAMLPGTGLSITGGGVVNHTNSVTAGTTSGITFDAQGHITTTTALVGGDLPVATSGVKGAVRPGTGLTVDGSGIINVSAATNAALGGVIVGSDFGVTTGTISLATQGGLTAGTYTKATFNSKGIATGGSTLTAGDIPNLAASQITSGSLDIARIATNSITGAKLANTSTALFGDTQPTAQYTGQLYFNSLSRDIYIWDSNVWQPIGISVGEIVFAGTFNASTGAGTGLVSSVTAEGTAIGLTVGSALPAAAAANNRYYLVVNEPGTVTSGNAPNVSLSPPDFILSNGAQWTEIDVSQTFTSVNASQVAFTPFGSLSATHVQAALEELDTEKLTAAGGTITGNLEIGTAGSLSFEGATANTFETFLTVVDPTADRTITLPDISGTVITTGDTGTVTSTMLLNGTILDADVNASAAIAYSKLATLTSGNIVLGSSANVATSTTVTGDVTISNLGVTAIASGVIVDADINASAAIVDTKLATIATAGKVSNSATTAASANTASAIVARDASGNFTAGTITAALTGTASGNLVSGGALGTPTSGTLTNCTGLPIGGLTASTSTALGVGSIELGHASDTTLSRSAAGVLAVEGVVIPSISSTSTLTNKTLTDPAIVGTILEDIFTITDGAAFEVDPGNGSIQLITLGASRTPKCTNMVAGESVTLMIDDGTAYTITWTDATWGTGGVVWKTNAGAAPTLNTSGYTVIVLWKVSTQVYGARVGDA